MTVTSCRQAFAPEQLACAATGPGHVFTGQVAREATAGLLIIADLQGDRLFSVTMAPVDQAVISRLRSALTWRNEVERRVSGRVTGA